MTPTGSGEVVARLRGEVVARLRDERAELLAEGPPDGRAWCLAWTDKVDRAIAQLNVQPGAGDELHAIGQNGSQPITKDGHGM